MEKELAKPPVEEKDPSIIELNVGGQKDFAIDKKLLLSAPDSRLSDTFGKNLNAQKMIEGKVFIDRDPEAFRLMLLFLRADRAQKPDMNDPFHNSLFEQELQYWRVDFTK